MGRKLHDLTGQRFGRLVVTAYLGRRCHASEWLCLCDCGTEKRILSVSLNAGQTRSCGCYQSERMSKLTFKHGERGGADRAIITKEYRAWMGMVRRCHNPADKGFGGYGGRGITVCDRWREDFAAFLADVGRAPARSASVDRIDGSRGYEPGNVRWATWTQQARNRRNNRIVSWGGRDMVLAEAIEMSGLAKHVVLKRLKTGWDLTRALTTPIIASKSSRLRHE